jgi:two-component system nitrogen regulation response regulator NtrX
MVGETQALRQVWDSIKRAAPTNATVLLLGESGSGKELVARSIHRNSLRSRDRFVQVNCAAIPEELIESELFGHEKGSFTGATEKQIGKFEQADHGTIFLDEVGDMSAKTQAKVLRVLQEGEVERLGSSKTMKVDVRVIAATNKRLEEEIDAGRFREDLYFRLSVIPIHVPPLRERTPDIPLLVKHFTELFNHESSFKPRRFSNDALAEMQQQRWRGNIRELRNTVERLLIMSRGDAVEAQDIREILRVADRQAAAAGGGAPVIPMSHAAAASEPTAPAAALAPSGTAPAAVEPAPRPGTLREFKEVSERAFLVDKLREFGWNISRTAEMLDTPRSNLYKKLDQYDIHREEPIREP